MGAEIDPRSDSSEARKRLRLLAAVLTTGVAIAVAAVVAENSAPSGFLPTVLLFIEVVVCLFVVATTVELAKERSPRMLLLASLAITATPFALIAVLGPFMSGGHDSASFSWMYFTFACVVSGPSLLVVAGVRFVNERRKRRSRSNE
jgi:hypothetical protein